MYQSLSGVVLPHTVFWLIGSDADLKQNTVKNLQEVHITIKQLPFFSSNRKRFASLGMVSS
jgi:hypothetical protein